MIDRTKTWIMRDGTRIPIRKMGDRHLLNTINMVDREAIRMRFEHPTYPVQEVYNALVAEKNKRGL